MSIKIKEKNNKNKVKEIDEQEKQVFKRILVKFRQYWRVLLVLMFSYIVCYMIWAFLFSETVRVYFRSKDLDAKTIWVVILAALLQGSLFCMDGFVTSLLKSPFSQMNQSINASSIITDEEKDYLTFRNTNSNENCKETLKKFGIITITSELVRVFLRNKEAGKGNYGFEYLMALSYIIPLVYVFWDIWRSYKVLKKIKNRLKKSQKSFA